MSFGVRLYPALRALLMGVPLLATGCLYVQAGGSFGPQLDAALHEQIEALRQEIRTLKAERKATPGHIKVEDLPEEERFRQLSTQSKHLVDTIKMIAYRAETAMANTLREHLKRPDEARSLLCALYATEADLIPDPNEGILTVRLHHLANASSDQAIEKLCEELNATETVFPRTNLRLVLKLGSK